MHSNFNDLKKTETMTDNEIKEDCLQEAGIDLGRYSHTEMTEMKDALRRYHQAKLKLLGIADVVVPKGTLCDHKWKKHNEDDIIKYCSKCYVNG